MHIIEKVTFDLQYEGKAIEPFDLQQEASRFCNDVLLPALEQRFDQLVSADEWIHLDVLELDAGLFEDIQDWDQVLEAILNDFDRLFSQDASKKSLSGRTEIQSTESALFTKWVQFLRSGDMRLLRKIDTPAFIESNILQAVASNRQYVNRLRDLLSKDRIAVVRLVRQHSERFLRSLAEAYTGTSFSNTTLPTRLKEHIKALSAYIRTLPNPTSPSSQITVTPGTHKPIEPELAWKVLHTLEQDFQEKYWAAVWTCILANEFSLREHLLLFTLFQLYIPPAEKSLILDTISHLAQYPERNESILFWSKALLPHFSQEAPRTPGIDTAIQDYTISDADSDFFVEQQRDTESTESKTDAPQRDIEISENQYNLEINPLSKSQTPDDTSERLAPGSSPDQVSPTESEDSRDSLGQKEVSADSTVETPEKRIQELWDEKQPPRQPKTQDHEYWYVDQAGLILLHPFLPQLFNTLGLVDGTDFKSLKKRQTGVYVLHYLSTGIINPLEYDLVLPRLLCAWPEDEPLQRPARLTKKTKQECHNLLEAVIGHWTKLGTTSPEGLQNGFLKRSGKLTHRPFDGWLLQVENSGIDVLLDYLPWGFGTIKLPWMNEILTVEWPH